MPDEKNSISEYEARTHELRATLRFQIKYFSPESIGDTFKTAVQLIGMQLLSKEILPEPIKNRLPLFYQSSQAQIKDVRDRLCLTEDGKTLLDFADRNGIKINIKDATGHYGGYVNSSNDIPTVTLKADTSPVQKTHILFHELRHIRQMAIVNAANGKGYFTRTPDRSPTVDAINGKIYEADAFTFETMQAIKLDQSGHPEYLRDIMSIPAIKDSPFHPIQKFIQENYPEKFKDEHQFARAIFGEVITKGLNFYEDTYNREAMYGNTGSYQLRDVSHDLLEAVNTLPPKPPLADDVLHRMTMLDKKSYLNGVSMDALMVDIVKTMNPKSIMILATKDRMIAHASELSPQEMNVLQDKIQDTYISGLRPYRGFMARMGARIATNLKLLFEDLIGKKEGVEGAAEKKADSLYRMPTDIEDRLGPPSTFGKKTAEKPTASPAPQAIAAVTVKRTKTL